MSDPNASDIYLVAYASLHETVRRFVDGEASRGYLAKRHRDIEEDLQQAVAIARAALGVRVDQPEKD